MNTNKHTHTLYTKHLNASDDFHFLTWKIFQHLTYIDCQLTIIMSPQAELFVMHYSGMFTWPKPLRGKWAQFWGYGVRMKAQ